jgi:hypothetical protein
MPQFLIKVEVWLPAFALTVTHILLGKWAEATERHKLQAFILAVMPAKAGIQHHEHGRNWHGFMLSFPHWTPAFAGVTSKLSGFSRKTDRNCVQRSGPSPA